METKDELIKKLVEENKKLKEELLDAKENYNWYYKKYHELKKKQ